MSDDSSELFARIATAVVSIPLLVGLIFWTTWGFFGLVLAAVGVTVWEYCSITYGDEHPPGKIVAIGLALGVTSVLHLTPEYLLEALLGAIGGTFLFFLFTFRDRERVSHQIGSSLTAIVYGALMLGVLGLLHDRPHGSVWVVLTMVTTWMSDTGAYFAGRSFGAHALYEEVSPNKSIEGSIGGIVGSVAGAAACNWGFAWIGDWTPLAVGSLLLLAIPGNILAQTGDLAESIIKRAHGVDDSGVIVYGHGGLLDRIDGLIFAAPWFYVCATYWL
jgi:phosphatidate cytidylyltransferase